MLCAAESNQTGFLTLMEGLKQQKISCGKFLLDDSTEPVIIPAERLTDFNWEQTLETAPVIITDPTPEVLASFTKTMPGGSAPTDGKADFFAARFDQHGNYYTFLQLESDQETDLCRYATPLLHWLEETYDPNSMEKEPQTMTNLDLVKIARAYVTTLSFELMGKSMILNIFAVSCHVFSGNPEASGDQGEDYFYIHETCLFDGGNSSGDFSYLKYWEPLRAYLYGGKYWVGGGEVCRHYINEYNVTNTLNTVFSSAKFIECAPVGVNREKEFVVSTGFNINGSISANIGKQGPQAGAQLGMGGSFNQSETMVTQDCTVSTRMKNEGRIIQWNYTFSRASQIQQTGKLQYLYDPALLSHTLAHFEQHWIWRLPTSGRGPYDKLNFNACGYGQVMATYSRNSGSVPAAHAMGNGDWKDGEVYIEWPALLAVDQLQVELDRNGGEKQITLGCEGPWTATANSGWLRCTPSQGKGGGDIRLFLLADTNNTGATRQASLTLKRTVSNETVSVLVTQYGK